GATGAASPRPGPGRPRRRSTLPELPARPLGLPDEPASELLRQEREALLEIQGELEVSRQNHADLYDLAPVGFVTFDRVGCILNLNQTGARLLDVPRTHMIGRPLLPLINKADRRNFLGHLARLRRGEKAATVEVTLSA